MVDDEKLMDVAYGKVKITNPLTRRIASELIDTHAKLLKARRDNATLAEQLKAAQDDAERLARSLMLWGADTSDDACDCELCKFERDALNQHEALVAQEAE
jgi:hypothetical protein